MEIGRTILENKWKFEKLNNDTVQEKLAGIKVATYEPKEGVS